MLYLTITLDHLLDEQGGVYAVINKTCRTCINNSAEVEINTQEIYEHLNGYVGSATPLPKLYGTQSKASSCFIPLSSMLQQFQVRLLMAQGFKPIPRR